MTYAPSKENHQSIMDVYDDQGYGVPFGDEDDFDCTPHPSQEQEDFDLPEWEEEFFATSIVSTPSAQVEIPPLEQWQIDQLEARGNQYMRAAQRQFKNRSPKYRRRDGSVGRHISKRDSYDSEFLHRKNLVFVDWDQQDWTDWTAHDTTPVANSPETDELVYTSQR